MKAEYDLSKMKFRKNPYASKLKQPVTMRLSEDVVAYFKSMTEDAGVPYQTLINLYLRDCLATGRKLTITWPEARQAAKDALIKRLRAQIATRVSRWARAEIYK